MGDSKKLVPIISFPKFLNEFYFILLLLMLLTETDFLSSLTLKDMGPHEKNRDSPCTTKTGKP